MRHVYTFIATGCYSGKLPLAPGTWGTAVGVLFYWFIGWMPTLAYCATVLAFIFLAVWASEHAARIYKKKDPQVVVIDEIAGYLVTMAFHKPTLSLMIAGFVLFRLFDIIKPPPARWFERSFPGGKGIVYDDLVAGIYANITLYGCIYLAGYLGINLI